VSVIAPPPGPTAQRPPTPRPTPGARKPRRPKELTADDIILLIASFGASLALCWLVFARFTDGVGWFGFLLCVEAAFLALYYLVNLEVHGRLVATDRTITAIVFSGALVVLAPLISLVFYIVSKGVPNLRLSFLLKDQSGITPIQPATAGGGSHAVVGTIEQVGLALVFALPLGLVTAVFLNETRSRWRRLVRIFVDAMSGIPSIVAGLFIFAVLILPYAKHFTLFSYNGFMASLALALMMLPTVTQTVSVVLRLVPDGLREASLAMGSTRARMVWSVVLPTARTGITTAVVLGIARIVGETAPLIFTAFGYDLMNANPIDGPQESLPLFIYRNIRKPDPNAISRGFVGALVLMIIVFSLFALARYIGRDRSKTNARRRARGATSAPSTPTELPALEALQP
jgi:phosphate transport system permease protein